MMNKVCNLEDFENVTQAHRKNWEMERAFGVMRNTITRRSARVLGVGAGYEHTVFWMTNHAEVHATDLYAAAGEWSGDAPLTMLINPLKCAPPDLDWKPENLIVQHMDARALRYPPNHFDAVFSASSIEHFGSLDDIAQAMREMARVLRPGGVLTLSTEWKIEGPGTGWPGVMVFDEALLNEWVIAPSGLDPIEPLDTTVSAATLATNCALVDAVLALQAGKKLKTPHIVLNHQGYVFTSVHIALKKAK